MVIKILIKMTEIIEIKIFNKIYIFNKNELMKKSGYFYSMLTHFKEKEENIIEINLDDSYQSKIVDVWYLFMTKDTINIEYLYDILRLCVYFDCQNDYLKILGNNLLEYRGYINKDIFVNVFYFCKYHDNYDLFLKFLDTFDWDYSSKKDFDENFLPFFDLIYLLDLEDYLKINKNILIKFEKYCPYIVNELSNNFFDIFRIDYQQFSYKPFFFELKSIGGYLYNNEGDMEETTDIKIIESGFNPRNRYVKGDNVRTKNLETFKKNLENFSYGLINDNFFENISNYLVNSKLYIGGGSILACILDKPIGNEQSDIDFWLCGNKPPYDDLKTFMQYISTKFKVPVYISINHSVITLVIPGYKRNIQILFSNGANMEQIVSSFDLPYIKCFYDGNKVYSDIEFIYSLITQSSELYTVVSHKRMYKMYHKGYHNRGGGIKYFSCYEDDCQVLSYMNKYYYPELDEINNENRMMLFIKKILGSDKVYSNLDKFINSVKFRQIYDKIEENEYFKILINKKPKDNIIYINNFKKKFNDTISENEKKEKDLPEDIIDKQLDNFSKYSLSSINYGYDFSKLYEEMFYDKKENELDNGTKLIKIIPVTIISPPLKFSKFNKIFWKIQFPYNSSRKWNKRIYFDMNECSPFYEFILKLNDDIPEYVKQTILINEKKTKRAQEYEDKYGIKKQNIVFISKKDNKKYLMLRVGPSIIDNIDDFDIDKSYELTFSIRKIYSLPYERYVEKRFYAILDKIEEYGLKNKYLKF